MTVTNVRKTIRDAVEVTLEPRDAKQFTFTQGQYLTFRRDFDGQELRRNYSICTAPGEPIRIGIKRVDGGVFSTWANEDLAAGDTLDAMPPQGRFFSPDTAPVGGHFVLFAGGSGITPVLSLIRTGLKQDARAQFTLVYANRSVATIMFREEIEDLKNRFMGRFSVIHVLEHDAQEIDLFTGRVDAEKCRRLFGGLVDIASVDCAYICGPQPMMLEIASALKDAGLAKDRIRFELFNADQKGRASKPALTRAAIAGTTARVTLDGSTREIDVPPGMSLLDAARAFGLDAPYACKAGVCSTCKCKLVAGEVEMVANHALEDYEVEAGFRLSCQSYAVGDGVEIDYDL